MLEFCFTDIFLSEGREGFYLTVYPKRVVGEGSTPTLSIKFTYGTRPKLSKCLEMLSNELNEDDRKRKELNERKLRTWL